MSYPVSKMYLHKKLAYFILDNFVIFFFAIYSLLFNS